MPYAGFASVQATLLRQLIDLALLLAQPVGVLAQACLHILRKHGPTAAEKPPTSAAPSAPTCTWLGRWSVARNGRTSARALASAAAASACRSLRCSSSVAVDAVAVVRESARASLSSARRVAAARSRRKAAAASSAAVL